MSNFQHAKYLVRVSRSFSLLSDLFNLSRPSSSPFWCSWTHGIQVSSLNELHLISQFTHDMKEWEVQRQPVENSSTLSAAYELRNQMRSSQFSVLCVLLERSKFMLMFCMIASLVSHLRFSSSHPAHKSRSRVLGWGANWNRTTPRSWKKERKKLESCKFLWNYWVFHSDKELNIFFLEISSNHLERIRIWIIMKCKYLRSMPSEWAFTQTENCWTLNCNIEKTLSNQHQKLELTHMKWRQSTTRASQIYVNCSPLATALA